MGLRLRAGQFYGETAQKLCAEGFSFTEKTYAPQSQLPQHSHELAHFCFVLAGGYRERLGANWEGGNIKEIKWKGPGFDLLWVKQ